MRRPGGIGISAAIIIMAAIPVGFVSAASMSAYAVTPAAIPVPTMSTPAAPAAAPTASPASAVLTLGTVLPDTGSLKAYGPATQAAVRLAVDDANAAGGVLGRPVALMPGDSGSVGGTSFARELARLVEAQAIIGPMSSQLVLDNLPAIDGRTLVSPAVTSPLLTGRLARVVPIESLQGAALATLAKRASAARLVVVAHRHDRATADAALDRAREIGLAATSVIYSERDPARIAARIVRSSSDALLLASGTETTAILRALLPRGMPATVLLTERAADAIDARQLRPGTLDGAQGIALDLAVPRSLARRISAVTPGVRETAYAPQAYDAAAVAILAAEQSGRLLGTVTPQGVRAALSAVTSVGTACDTLARCLRLLRRGEDIAYVGYTGPVDLGSDGDPQAARYLVATYTEANKPSSTSRPLHYGSMPVR